MDIYKFHTTIPQNGLLQIPAHLPFYDQEVEIIIRPKLKEKSPTEKAEAIQQFITEWSGLLKGEDPDLLKATYLEDKYK